MRPPPSSISVKKSMRTLCRSLLWSFLTTLCSVMNIGALSGIWHLPAKQILSRSGAGGYSWLYYSGWFQVIGPSTALTSTQWTTRVGSAVRRGTPISKAWSATWFMQWQISQRRHYIIQDMGDHRDLGNVWRPQVAIWKNNWYTILVTLVGKIVHI